MIKGSKKSLGVHQRRTRFVREYLIDQNATRAAIAAGYAANSADVTGARLLGKASVRSEIERLNAEVNAKLEVTVERVKAELARLAFYDPRAFWNPDGSAKPITELDEDTARCLAGFEVAELFTGSGEERATAGYVKKFKLSDKGLNLERLGRHLQMFPTKVEMQVEHKVKDVRSIEERIAELERELGYADTIDEAGRTGTAQAGNGRVENEEQAAHVLPGNGAAKTGTVS